MFVWFDGNGVLLLRPAQSAGWVFLGYSSLFYYFDSGFICVVFLGFNPGLAVGEVWGLFVVHFSYIYIKYTDLPSEVQKHHKKNVFFSISACGFFSVRIVQFWLGTDHLWWDCS